MVGAVSHDGYSIIPISDLQPGKACGGFVFVSVHKPLNSSVPLFMDLYLYSAFLVLMTTQSSLQYSFTFTQLMKLN